MDKLPVAQHLTDEEYITLLMSNASHNCRLCIEDKSACLLSEITKIVRLPERLIVYFKNGLVEEYHK